MSNLSEHVLSFCRYLRSQDFLIGLKETEDSLRALEAIDIGEHEQFRLALKIVLCSSREEQFVFDRAFPLFFANHFSNQSLVPFLSTDKQVDGRLNAGTAREQVEERSEKAAEMGDTDAKENHSVESAVANGKDESEKAEKEYRKAFRWFAAHAINKRPRERKVPISSSQLYHMEKAAQRFVRRIQIKQSRRFAAMKKGRKFDERRTLRNSLQTGGVPAAPVWKGRKKVKAKFVLLCDGSRSMAAYTDQFLQFAYAMTECTRHVEVFLFSTKLKRVTSQLKKGRGGQLPVLTVFENEWGGGTRIGESLCSFVQQYGSQMLRKETVIMVVSDGLDSGNIVNLPWAMKEMKQRTSAVIWLNPLLNITGYQPEARGMKAALPYIDVFSEAQNPESFQKLSRTITIRR
ncbi:VWA domain-containing protein [Pseudobacillus sp. 179-B 2D1 NHS]|uniref:vWA domain-containing protein n=1 Tax=Pseudobacillus sp. 179-B 2D1 NHS TaxID=3374292 RepID=UPI00387A4C19